MQRPEAFVIDATLGELEFEAEENEIALKNVKDLNGEWAFVVPIELQQGLKATRRPMRRKWQESLAEETSKKRKVEEETVEKVKMVKLLADRDQSISVLRSLAVEKEEKAKLAQGKVEKQEGDIASSKPEAKASQTSSTATSEIKPAIDYSAMPLERLKALEKARDATLSFLLKRIDKAEAALASLNGEG